MFLCTAIVVRKHGELTKESGLTLPTLYNNKQQNFGKYQIQFNNIIDQILSSDVDVDDATINKYV